MNYTAADIAGVGAGFVLFALFAFAPGYTVGWLSNVFAFRRRRLATRVAAAVPLSIGVMPIAGYLLWRCWLPLVWVVFGACGAACVVLLARDARALGLRLTRAGWGVLGIAAGWLVGGTLSLVDWQFGDRLYVPVSTHDRATRAAFTAALARGGIPPHNPFFFAAQPAPLRYHYFWLIPASLVDRLGGSLVSARLALIAGVLWSGLGLMAVVALYLRFFQSKGGEQIERRTLIAVSLLGVTGLDIIPVFLIDVAGRGVMASVEWWNLSGAIASWINTTMWAPHDLASLVAGLTGFVLVWDGARREGSQRIGEVAAAGLAFASAVGCSIYVGGTVAAGCALWLAITCVARMRCHAFGLVSAGAVAAISLMPFILQVTHGLDPGGSTAVAKTTLPFGLTVRPFGFIDDIMRVSNPAKLLAQNAALLPLNYFFEFGFFFVVGWLAVRRIWRHGFRDRAEWAAGALGAASLLICTFLRSTVISYNDLGWRSPLVVQFVLLVWAAEMWHRGELETGAEQRGSTVARSGRMRRLVVATLVFGAMGSCYELCVQRVFPILSDFKVRPQLTWLSKDQQLGRRMFAMRSAYERLDRLLPGSAVVQADPMEGIGNLPADLYSDRQMVADVGDCGTVFGGSGKFCRDVILPQLKPLFDDRHPVTATEVEKTCTEFSIAALLFGDTDPVWKDESSWIWKAHPLFSNHYVRVIACGQVTETGAKEWFSSPLLGAPQAGFLLPGLIRFRLIEVRPSESAIRNEPEPGASLTMKNLRRGSQARGAGA